MRNHQRASLLVLVAVLAACRSASIVESAAGAPLPESWQGWSLFRSERVWIYAEDERAADDAAKLVEEAAADFRARSGREPDLRLLVVADGEGWMPGGDPRRRHGLMTEGEALLPREPPEDDEDGPDTWEEIEEAAGEIHVEPALLLSMNAHPLALARLGAEFGLPAENVRDAAVLLPTRALLAEGVEEVTDSALREEAPLAVRLLAAPFLPFARREAVNGVLGQQKALLFELFAAGIADWSPVERARVVAGYRDTMEESFEFELEGEPEPDE